MLAPVQKKRPAERGLRAIGLGTGTHSLRYAGQIFEVGPKAKRRWKKLPNPCPQITRPKVRAVAYGNTAFDFAERRFRGRADIERYRPRYPRRMSWSAVRQDTSEWISGLPHAAVVELPKEAYRYL